MRQKLLSTLIAGLFVASPALAQNADPFFSEGGVSVGPIYVDQDAQDATRLEEYQDLGNGALSNAWFRGRNSRYWIDAYGENFGRDDQFVYLRGGMYDVFKYGAFSNSLRHNFTFNARTPFAGVGTDQLIATFPQPNPNTWNTFDQNYKRIDNGAFFEWQGLSPWYFRVDGNQVRFDGTKVGAASNGTSPGQGYTDLPLPVDYKTNNYGMEAGYQSGSMTFAARWDYSKFENAFETVQWSNPFWGNRLDTTYLPPDNEFNKLTLTGNVRNLPMNSVLSARYTWAKTESHFDIGAFALNSAVGTGLAPTLADPSTFNGEHINQSFQAAWTARPMAGLDTRLFYYYTELENNSDLVEFGHAPTTPLASGLGCGTVPGLTPGSTVVGNCENELFQYEKHNIGFDAYYRIARGHRIGAGWEYVDLDQHRFDYHGFESNKFFVEYKNTMLDNFVGRIKWTYLDRDADFALADSGANPNDVLYLLRFTSAFDMQDVESNQLKLQLDWAPMPAFDVSFEANWSDNDYKDNVLGRQSNKRQQYTLTAGYGMAGGVRLTAFVDWEQIKDRSNHRNIGAGSCPTSIPAAGGGGTATNCFDPATPPNSIAYNWADHVKDENLTVGVAVDWPVNEKLLVKGSYLYMETDGSSDFDVQKLASGADIPGVIQPIPIAHFDDTKRHSFNLKGLYSYDRNWLFTLGYAYEKFDHKDVGYDGYTYTIPFPGVTNNTSQSYLNGYNAFIDGDQHIFYGLVTFRF